MAGIDDYQNYKNNKFKDLRDDADSGWEPAFPEGLTTPSRSIRPRELEIKPRVPPRSPEEDEEAAVRRYVGVGVGLATLITENLLSHPFVVLRRQCQVHNASSRYHLVPITLVPIIIHLHQRQGITTLCKGLGSILLVRGMTLAVEDLISKFTPWPKEVNSESSLKAFGQHILLKCISLAIVTPFYSASLVETVQSDIASEKPGIFDVFKEGVVRLVSWGSPQKGRMLPVWALVTPTVMYGLLKYLVCLFTRGVTSRVLHQQRRAIKERQGAFPREMAQTSEDIEITSSLVGLVTADVLLFPLETILHRLHLQGTRTIIDNLDSGYAVTPILTSYSGIRDCYRTTIQQEGVPGLYKGFGALVLQFAAHVAVIKLAKVMLTELGRLLSGSGGNGSPKPPTPQEEIITESFRPQSYPYAQQQIPSYPRQQYPRYPPTDLSHASTPSGDAAHPQFFWTH
ncbi:hypothetical protein FOCC_FOCC003504 [Frankliniella occidentalis]|uniref:Mitochondrial outer membrane protein SLC25A46 n=1 Tax=Frankliniella occidentalis TaxID=133901 RepID=A0A6J1T468_FRAOC|nr:mitochondrial outer membrane protein SLC25A46 [Frankliniella occidentalis]KAE8749764.1 hypothetical protein FOCC_FOCC003504 [Frankliniella occidentalis]